MNTVTNSAQAEAREKALIIRSQIQVGVFMALGASDLGWRRDKTAPTFGFLARVIPSGFTRPRKVFVEVSLNRADLYDITITWYPRRSDSQPTVRTIAADVDVTALNKTLLAIDDADNPVI